MALEVEKSSLSINQIISNKSDTTTIEGEYIVPDIKPDIIDIIGTSGIVSINKREITEGKIRIDGSVHTYIIYNGNDENSTVVRGLNHMLDFSQIIIVPDAKEGMQDMGNIELENISCTIINERKVKIKANLRININLSNNTNEEYVSNIQVKELQKIDSKVDVNTVLGTGNTKTGISETISIDSTDTIAEILQVKTDITNTDTKVSYNKILVKSEVTMTILYSTEDGRYNISKNTFPIMGFVDMKDVTEENIIIPNIEIKNVILKPNGSQEHTISVDMEIGINVVVFGNKEIEIIKDMYSPMTNLAFNKKTISTMQNMKICKSTMNFNKKEFLDIGDERIYDIQSRLNITEIKPSNNYVVVVGNIQFLFFHSRNRMTGLEVKKIEVPFEYKIICDGINANSKMELKANTTNENYNILTGGEIDIRLDVDFTITSYNKVSIEIIDNVEDTEIKTVNPYNMVVYYTREGDTLWNIAKEFRSTRAQIMTDNSLKNETLEPGMQLFISRY